MPSGKKDSLQLHPARRRRRTHHVPPEAGRGAGRRGRVRRKADQVFYRNEIQPLCSSVFWASTICSFLQDLGSGMLGMTLDRIDNDGDYESWQLPLGDRAAASQTP